MVHYFKGFHDARNGRPKVWDAGWSREQGNNYDRGYDAGF